MFFLGPEYCLIVNLPKQGESPALVDNRTDVAIPRIGRSAGPSQRKRRALGGNLTSGMPTARGPPRGELL
jgi:hypothetical protein